MKSNTFDLLVGLLFFAGMGILGFVTIFKAQRFGTTKLYRIRFPKVYGLKEGSPVRCEGKQVGEVKRLELVESFVRATVEVSDEVNIYKSRSRVAVTPFSPLGGRVVEITRGDPESGEYEPATIVDGQPDGTVIQGDAEGELITVITQLIEENRGKIDEIVENVRLATGQLRRTNNLLGKTLNDEQFADDFGEIAASAKRAAGHLDEILARIDRGEGVIGDLTVDDSPLKDNVDRTFKGAGDATEELAVFAKKLNEGEGAIPTLINDAQTGEDVRAITANLASATEPLGEGRGLMRLFTEEEVYENIRSASGDISELTSSANNPNTPIGVALKDEAAGEDLRSILSNLETTTERINDPKAGLVGALTSDGELATKTRDIFDEIGRVLKEFRDSLEDVREQAPVNAFIGTVFSAF